MLRIRLLCSVCVGLVVALPAVASATPYLVEDEQGDATLLLQVLQQANRPYETASAAPHGAFGPLTRLSAPPQSAAGPPQVVADERGGAVAAWIGRAGTPEHPYGVAFASIKPPGGGLGEPVRLSTEGDDTSGIALDVNASGDAIAAWVDHATGDAQYAVRPAGGSFGPPQPLPGQIRRYVHVVIEAGGGALFVGDNSPGIDLPKDYAIYRRSDGTLTGASEIPGAQFTSAAAIVGNRRGDVLAAWADEGEIVGRERPAGGDFGPEMVLARDTRFQAFTTRVAGTMNDAGDVVLTASEDPKVTALVRRGAHGTFESRTLTAGTDGVSVAMNERGDAVAAWHRPDVGVSAAYSPAGAHSFGPGTVLARPLAGAPPGAAIDGEGVATVLWEASDGETVRLLAGRVAGGRVTKAPAAGATPAYVQEAPREACKPSGAREVLSDDRAVVSVTSTNFVVACLFERGVPIDLGRTHPPAHLGTFEDLASTLVALRGPFAASVVVGTSHGVLDMSPHYVSIVDLRDEDGAFSRSAPVLGRFGLHATVGALQVRDDGAAAWIACSTRPYKGRPAAPCVLGGRATKRVVVLPSLGASSNGSRTVAAGRNIDPASLSLSGGRVYWRDGTSVRVAPLN